MAKPTGAPVGGHAVVAVAAVTAAVVANGGASVTIEAVCDVISGTSSSIINECELTQIAPG